MDKLILTKNVWFCKKFAEVFVTVQNLMFLVVRCVATNFFQSTHFRGNQQFVRGENLVFHKLYLIIIIIAVR